MNDCKNIESKLIFYFYKELNNLEMENIKNHLASCSNCSKLYNNLSDSLFVVETEKKIEVNPFIETRINQKIKEFENSQTQRNMVVFRKIIQSAMSVAAVSIGILFGVFFGSFYSTTDNSYNTATNYESVEYYMNDLEHEPFLSYVLEE